MRLGLQVPDFSWPGGHMELGERFGQVAQRAEAAGFASLWVMDHFFQIHMVGPPDAEMLEGWSALAFAAGRTSRIQLGTLVTGVTYRYPGLLVKTVTTLDVLSGGRAYMGIGAAWNEEEHRGLGVPFPAMAERFERLEETLQIALQMWSGDQRAYRGRHHTLERPLNVPPPVRRPHPPILIGGSGERKTLRLVAQYADACNLFASDVAVLPHKLEVLRAHCDTVGRNYDDIEKTTLSRLDVTRHGSGGSMTPQAAVEHLGRLADLGIDHAIVSVPEVYDEERFDVLGTDVIPAAAKLNVAGR